jgi:hypothetical protein
MSVGVQKWVFRAVTIFAPVVVAVLLEVQRQVDSGGDILWRPITSALIGSFVIALAHIVRVFGGEPTS